MRRICLFGSIVVLLSGCSANPGAYINCQHINWHRLGQQDGTNGNYRQNLAATFPSCGPNIVVNKAQYQAGWRIGINEYCLPRNGMRLGMEGKMYNNVCPASQVGDFDKAWRDGLKKFCVPHNGYILGLEGKDFPSFCPPNLNPAFHRAYRRGAGHYQQLVGVKTKLDKVKNQLSQVHQLHKTEQHNLHTMKALYSQHSFSPQKQYRIQKINIKVKRLASKAKMLQAEKEKLTTRYESLKKTFLKMD